jgi:hypothetical protein
MSELLIKLIWSSTLTPWLVVFLPILLYPVNVVLFLVVGDFSYHVGTFKRFLQVFLLLVWVLGDYIHTHMVWKRTHCVPSFRDVLMEFLEPSAPTTTLEKNEEMRDKEVESESIHHDTNTTDNTPVQPSAYEEVLEKDWEILSRLIDTYKTNDTIYLGNDFPHKSLGFELKERLEKRGYSYIEGERGVPSRHKLQMRVPSECILF